MDAIIAANAGAAPSYGNDNHSRQLDTCFSDFFDTRVRVFPVVSGTAANALALATLTPRYGKVFCSSISHINTDECAAPEFYTAGAKLIDIYCPNGKLQPDALQGMIRGAGFVHTSQPATLSITQSCETGVVYSCDEIAALTEIARAHRLRTHMDGARFANALATLKASPADVTWRAGVDVLSFGGTKNGCLAAEAVVFFNPAHAQNLPFLQKRGGHLLAKTRFLSAQLIAYIKDDLWLRNAQHANSMASALSQGMTAIDGVEIAYPTQTNEVFAHIPKPIIDNMNKIGFAIEESGLDGMTPPRFVTAWNTQTKELDTFLQAMRNAVQPTAI